MLNNRLYLVALNAVNKRPVSLYACLHNVDQTEKQRNYAIANEIKIETRKKYATLDTKFESTEIAYHTKTNSELYRGLVVFNLCSVEYFVNNQIRLLGLLQKVIGTTLFQLLMKKTVFGHFCAGSNEEEISKTVQRMKKAGITSAIYYSVEADLADQNSNISKKTETAIGNTPNYYHKSEAHCDKNTESVLRSFEKAAALTSPNSISAIKVTSLLRVELLLKLSEMTFKFQQADKKASLSVPSKSVFEFLDDTHMKMDLNEWKQTLTSQTYFGKVLAVKNYDLTTNEIGEIRNFLKRLEIISQKALDLNVDVLVDAEQTYYQWAITELAMEQMKHYNKKKPLIINGYQNYLKSTHVTLKEHLDRSRNEGFCFGAKLVRGAYIEQEVKRANDMGYENPIHNGFDATTDNYETNALLCLNEIKSRQPGTMKTVFASHNEGTVRYVVKKLNELNIDPNCGSIIFGQLLGMQDYITYNLGVAGYPVLKITPYGPLDEVLPYLVRRANENRGIFDKVKKEKRLLIKELLRRYRKGQFVYNI